MSTPRRSRVRRQAALRLAVFALLSSGATALAWPSTGAGAQGVGPPPGGVVTSPAGIQLGVSIRPDTVTIGTPFIVSVRVRAPLGAEIDFPAGPDSTFAIQALDPVRIDDAGDSLAIDRTALYRMAAWDVGSQAISIPPVTVRTATTARSLTVAVPSVFVRSVLPQDSAQRVPKPARDLFVFPVSNWLWWLLAALAAAIVGGLLWWWWRRRRARAIGAAGVDPFTDAEAAFARIDALGLIEAGERGRYVALVTEVLRDYLAARESAASTSLTSRELASLLARSPIVPVERLSAVLREADLVKFAARPISASRATELGVESRAIVRDVEAARAAAIAEAVARAEREADAAKGADRDADDRRGAAA